MADTKQKIELEDTEEIKKVLDSILETRKERLEDLEDAKQVSVVACIPALNEEKTIAQVVLRTKKYVDHVIVCDDGSTDMTSEIAEGLGAIVTKHPANQGKGAALRSAFQEAVKLDPMYIVAIDGDGQHQPEEIPSLITPLEIEEADMVIGSRYLKGDTSEIPFYRKIGLGVIDRIFKHNINQEVSDSQSGFRAYTRETLNKILDTKSNGFGVETEQLDIATREGLRVKEVESKILYNGLENTSKEHPIRHGTEILSSILNLVVTKRPIELLGTPGFISTIIGIITLSMFLYHFNTTGYISLALAIISTATIIFGTMLILIAMVLYAIREVNNQPRIRTS